MGEPALTHGPKQRSVQTKRQRTMRRLQRGQSLAELSLSLTVLLLLLSGIVDLGRAFFAKIALDNMISEGAHWAAGYPGCIAYAQNATNAPQIPPNCRGTNSIIGRMLNENKDLDRVRFTAVSVTPVTAAAGDQLVISLTYQVPTITPIIQSLFGASLPLTVQAIELVRGSSVPDFPGGTMAQPAGLSPVNPVGNISYTCYNGGARLSWAAVQATGYHVFLGSSQIATIPIGTDPVTWVDPANPPRPGAGSSIIYTVTSYNSDGGPPPVIVDSAPRTVTANCSSIQPKINAQTDMPRGYVCTPLGATYSWSMPIPLDTAVAGYRILRYQNLSGTWIYKTMGTVSGANTLSGTINFDANPPDGTPDGKTMYQIQSLNGNGTPIGTKSDPVIIDCPPTTADLSISVTGNPDPYVVVGSPLTYTITVTNAGPLMATNVVMKATLDPTVVLNSGSLLPGCSVTGIQQVTCTLASLNFGTSTTFTITVTPQSIGTISTSATVTADQPDPTTPNTAGLTTTVTPPPDLAISFLPSAPVNVAVDSNITYTITISNDPTPLVNPTVIDTIPTGLTYVSCTPSCIQNSPNPGQVTFSGLGIMNGSTSKTVTLVLNVPLNYMPSNPAPTGCAYPTTGCIQNQASVYPNDTQSPWDNTASVLTPVIDLQMLSVTNSPSSVAAGSNITYQITAKNIGPDAPNVTVSFAYPPAANLAFMSGSSSPGCSTGSGTVNCTVGPLAAGATTTVTLAFSVPSIYTGPTTFTSTATVSPADPTPNNTANVSTTVLVPDLVILVPSYTTSVQAGSNNNNGNNVTYTIQVQNNGTAAASNVTITDTIPAGMTFDPAANPGWTQTGLTTLTYPLPGGSLAPSASASPVTLVLGVKRDYNSGATIQNTLTVNPTDSNPSNNSTTPPVSTTVTAPQIWGVTGSCSLQGSKYIFTFNWSAYPSMWNVTKYVIASSSPAVTWTVMSGTTMPYYSPNMAWSAGTYTFTITAYDANGPIAGSAVTISITCL